MGNKLLTLGICMILLAHSSFVLGFGEKPGKPSETLPYRVEISTDKNTYSAGEKIIVSIKVTNTSSEAISSYYSSSQKYDFIVSDKDGAEVWRWSHNKMFLMEVIPFQLKINEKLKFNYIWDQKDNSGKNVPAGEYYVTGTLTVSPKVNSQTICIDII